MSKKTLITLTLLVLAVSALAMSPQNGKFSQKEKLLLDTDTWIDVNQILMFVTNKGSFAYDQGGYFGKNDGLYFPFTTVQDILDQKNVTSVLFASGIWVAAVDNASGDTLVSAAEYSDDYFPGPIVGGTWVANADTRPEYRVYKLFKDSLAGNPNQDYLNWPVSQGAPVDSSGNPAMIGDQMCWAVYNDINPAPHTNDLASDSGLGVEIRQTTFGFNRTDALADVVFIKLQIYNKGGRDLSNMKLTLWSDPDLGDAGDDFVGSDTVLSLAYCYNATNNDATFKSRPPAVGYDFFQGPLVFTGDNADTATMWNFQKFVGYQNMPMTAMMMYRNGEDPASPTETYQYMSGLLAKQGGAPLPNGTTFYAPGDPVTGTGDLDNNASDRRYMLTTGPFDFAPGDSTEILAAVVVGQGGDRKSSVSVLRYNDKFAQQAYDNEFNLLQPPAPPNVTLYELNNEIGLVWNDTSEVDPGDYPFQGYSIFQGEAATGPWTRIGNYDIIDGAAIILDDVLDPLTGVLEQRAVKFGSDNGIRRYFNIKDDALTGNKLANNTEYFFRVEAYSYNSDPLATPKTLTSATIASGIPQQPIAGKDINAAFANEIVATHTTGVSDGTVIAKVVDPTAITGDSYRVIFVPDSVFTISSIDSTVIPFDTTIDTTVNVLWNLINTTSIPEDTVIKKFKNQSNDEVYPIVDGMLVKVAGPAPGFKSFEVVANGSGPLNPPAGGALDFQGFPSITPDAAYQQQGGARWAFHTADNGGSCGGGTRGSYDAFLFRVLRDGANSARVGVYDYEMRFTGDTNSAGVYDSSLGGGSIGIRAFDDGYPTWVPFEIWRTGIGTPTDSSDDVRMIVWHLDDGGDTTYNLESWGCITDPLRSAADGEHSASGGDNDPFTDWIYWRIPVDTTPGDAGYQQKAADMLAGTYDYADPEVFARTVLVSWNGHLLDSQVDSLLTGDTLTIPPVFIQKLPEPGTIFRISTFKPNALSDEFVINTAAYAPTVASSGPATVLDKIKAVPNPYYLSSTYDNNLNNRRMKFTNLPAKCSITIYNLAGSFVTRIEKNDANTSETTWDLNNDANVPVASGIYIYVVEAPGFGQKIGKMAIFTEIEILNQY